MNSFTKVLIVFLTLISIFLCGSVVTYVISTSNAMEKYETAKSNIETLKAKTNMQLRQADESLVKASNEIKSLKDRVAALEDEKNSIMIELKNAQHDVIKWQDRVNGWAGVVKSFEQTISEQEKSLVLTRKQLTDEQTKNLKLSNRLNEMTTSLDEHIVMLDALKAEKRRCQEKNAILNNMVNGETPPASEPVTMNKSANSANVSMAESNVVYGPIEGIVSNVKNDLVSLSVGKADGVKPGMKFHIVRGVSFICDVTVTDVDTNKCVGVIGLKNSVPKIGDSASTEL